jgi:hypothetical protein
MSEDIRWKTKAGFKEQGEVRQDILDYYQDTTRQRGYPPFLLEIGLRFDMNKPQAAHEYTLIIQHLAHINYEQQKPKQDVDMLLEPKTVAPASKTVDLKPFTGRNGWPDLRDRMIYWHDAAEIGYLPGTVDYVLHDEQIALTPETESYFYSSDAVNLPDYQQGSRPYLEKVLQETTEGCQTDRAKALALVRLIGNPDTSPYRDPAYIDMYGPNYFERPLGGTEEQVLQKGWHMCNEITRALVFLCQIARIPARTLFLFTDPLTHVGGHAVTEIFFDGKWNLVENNQGVMFLTDGGYFASAVEIRDNPAIVNRRPDVGLGLCLCHACYTGPISVLQYSIDRVDHYSYATQPFK